MPLIITVVIVSKHRRNIETLESEIGPHSDKTITFFGKNSFNEIKNGDKFKQWADEYTSEVKFIE